MQLTADEAGLTPMSSAGLPRGGTYWVILPGYRGNVNPLPYPCLPFALTNSPIYDITGNIYLVDATGGQVLTGGNPSGTRANSSTIASVLALQANTVENLILMVQGAAALSTSTTMSANAKPMGQGLSPAFSTQNGPWPYLTIAPGGNKPAFDHRNQHQHGDVLSANDAGAGGFELSLCHHYQRGCRADEFYCSNRALCERIFPGADGHQQSGARRDRRVH